MAAALALGVLSVAAASAHSTSTGGGGHQAARIFSAFSFGAAGDVVRVLPPVFADASGKLQTTVDNTSALIAGSAAPIVAGATLNFQAWYRDPAGGPSGFNLSDGLGITFCP